MTVAVSNAVWLLLLALERANANRAPAPGPAPPPAPGQSKNDFHLLAELESHWLAGLVVAAVLIFVVEHRPAFLFGKQPVASRDLKVPDGGEPASRDLHVPTAAEAAEAVGPMMKASLRVLTPLAKAMLKGLVALLILLSPFIRVAAIAVYHLYLITPKNILRMIYGLVLCFFGGTFVATLSAVEAFNALGGQKVIPDFLLIVEQAQIAWKASHEEEKGGVLSGVGSTMSRTHRAMAKIEKPQELQTSIGACVAISMAVLSTLRFQFAKTVSLAVGAASLLKAPLVSLLGPVLKQLLGEDLEQWVETIIDVALKSVALSFAWYLQMVVSAFYSGIRGGTLFMSGLLMLLHVHGKKPSYLDELFGYPLAAAGFYCQLTSKFSLPHPWNIALFPLTFVEYSLRWAITYAEAVH